MKAQSAPATNTIQYMLSLEGIRSAKDLQAFTTKHRLGAESPYNVLVRKFGENNADKIMRLAEVASWDLRTTSKKKVTQ